MNTDHKHCWHETSSVYAQIGSGTRVCCHCGQAQHIIKIAAQIPHGHGKHFPIETVNKWIDD